MRVVGIDQSYTGFGYSTGGEAIKKGFPASKYPNPYDRLWSIEKWLGNCLDEVIDQDSRNLDLIVMEGYANAAKFGREAAGELGWAVKRTCYARNFEPLVVPPTSLKKFVTGKGNAAKNEMLLGVYKQWGVSFADDNQADAYSLEQFGRAYLQETGARVSSIEEPIRLHKYQIEAIQKVKAGK